MTDAEVLPLGWPANGLRPHPIAGIFRLMEDGERADLVKRIKANGLRQAIVMFEGKILDGRNRYLAAVAAEVFPADADWQNSPHFEAFGGDDWDAARGTDPLEFVWDTNEGRRHDTVSQRAMNAARYATMKQGERNDLRARALGGAELFPRETANLQKVSLGLAAEKAGVSERAAASAAAVLDHGAPELVAAVDQGKLAVSAAEQVAKLPQDEQREIVAGDKRTVKKRAAAVAKRPKATEQRVQPLKMQAFAGFAQSVLNLVRGQPHIAAQSLVDLAVQRGIVRVEGEGFVFTEEALAAMGTLAAAVTKPIAEPVRSPVTEALEPQAVYLRELLAVESQKGKHTVGSAEAVLRAGVAANIKRQKIANDLGHPLGTVQGWTAKLKLTDPARLHEPTPGNWLRNKAHAGASA